jgi:hypothetical protein
MCKTCDEVKDMPQDQALIKIGEEMKRGKNPDHFKLVLDFLLGTEEPKSNSDLDEIWEKSNRKGNV